MDNLSNQNSVNSISNLATSTTATDGLRIQSYIIDEATIDAPADRIYADYQNNWYGRINGTDADLLTTSTPASDYVVRSGGLVSWDSDSTTGHPNVGVVDTVVDIMVVIKELTDRICALEEQLKELQERDPQEIILDKWIDILSPKSA